MLPVEVFEWGRKKQTCLGWGRGHLFLCVLSCLYLAGWEHEWCEWLEKAAALSWRKCKRMLRAILKRIHPCRMAGPVMEGEGGDAGTAVLRALNQMPPIHMAMWSEVFHGSSDLETSWKVFKCHFYGLLKHKCPFFIPQRNFMRRKAGEKQPPSDPAAWFLLLSWAKEALQSGKCISSPVVGKLCFNNGITDSAWRNISCKNGKEAWKRVPV